MLLFLLISIVPIVYNDNEQIHRSRENNTAFVEIKCNSKLFAYACEQQKGLKEAH